MLPRRNYFFAERLPAPFLGGPLPLRFSRSALFCQYLQWVRDCRFGGPVKVLGGGRGGRHRTLGRDRGTERLP